jgi:hypothetical protein
MSRDLPANPSLEHLKKQAKELLRQNRQQDARATLANAQYTLAREYGFRSWLALKAHVESAPGGAGGGGGRASAPSGGGPPPNHAFERYTPKAREALFYSRFEAAQAGSGGIAPAHLLLGLVRASQDFASRILARLSLEEARTAIAAAMPPGAALPNSHVIPFDGATRRALLKAVEEADRQGHRGIGIVHLILGLLDETGSVGARLLTAAGVNAVAIRQDVERLQDESARST